MYMKAVQVLFDEALLRRLDEDAEVRAHGRSAVLRRAAAEYLRRRRSKTIADAYARAYGNRRVRTELVGWPDEGVWPEK
jgi:predicted transcriptional regulator